MTASRQALFQVAEDEFERGEFASALLRYRQVLLDFLAESDPTQGIATRLTEAEVVMLERLADLAALFGEWDEAQQLLTSLRQLFEDAGNLYAADYICLKQVALEIGRGRLRHARQLLREMATSIGDCDLIPFTSAGFAQWEAGRYWPDTNAADREVLFSRLYLEIGRLEAANGQYDRAVAALKRGLLHCQPGAPALARQAEVPLLLAIAASRLEQGDLQSAAVVVLDLPGQFDEAQQPGLAVQRLAILGKLDLLTGDLGPAKRHFERVLEICQDGQFEQAVPKATLNLAHILIYLNQTRAASHLLERARARALQRNDVSTLVRAEMLLRVAIERGRSLAEEVCIAPSVTRIWKGPGEPMPEADPYNPRHPSDIPPSDNYLALFEERALGFHWLLARYDWQGASQYLQEIFEAYQGTDSLLVQGRLLVMECMLTYYTGEIERAARGFEEIRPILQKMGLKPELWQVMRFLGWCASRSSRPHDAEVAVTEAERLLTEMTESLSASERSIFQLNKWTADEEYIASEVNQLSQMKVSMASVNWLRRVRLQHRIRKRLAMLLDHVDRYKATVVERTVRGFDVPAEEGKKSSLWGRLWCHARDRATISFVVLPDRVLIVRTGWLDLNFGVSMLTRLQVRALVRAWHELILDGDLAGAQSALETLADALQIGPIIDELPSRIRALTFVPDDSLHGLPFSAMSWRGKYLVERYAIARAFEWTLKRQSRPRVKPALVVAVTEGNDDFPSLPTTQTEINDVKDLLCRRGIPVTTLAGGEASKATILRGLSEVGFFHIACHGVFQPDLPDRSGLVLVTQSGATEVLSLRELAELDLCNLEQVVLSSCWSADNFILPGRWIISPPEVLLRRGVRSVMGCLWEVDGRLSGPFMKRFYENLEEMPRDEALRQTQLACIERRLCEKMDTADPVYWAGFCAYGDTGRLPAI
jgi:CHAT domain-containing protein